MNNSQRPFISAILRPSAAIAPLLARQGIEDRKVVENPLRALDALLAVDKLGALIDEGLSRSTSVDGRVDLHDVAAFILSNLREATFSRVAIAEREGRTGCNIGADVMCVEPDFPVQVAAAASALVPVLDKAIANALRPGGRIDLRAAAAFVLKTIKES